MKKTSIVLSASYLLIIIAILGSQSGFKLRLIQVFGVYTFLIFVLFVSASPKKGRITPN